LTVGIVSALTRLELGCTAQIHVLYHEPMRQNREPTKVVMLIAVGLAALAMSACHVESCAEKGRCPDSKPYVPRRRAPIQ
jgi:hypothetical protein